MNAFVNKLNGAAHNGADAIKAKVRGTRTKIAEAITPEVDRQNVFARYAAAQEDMLRAFGVPSGTRAMVAFGTSMLVAAGVGLVGGALIDVLVMGALTLTGSALLGTVVWVLGFVITVISGVHVASWTYGYIASQRIDAHYNAAKAFVAGLLPKANAMVHGHE
jgi:hypothetical protein